jgi:arabinogalactan oligomer / maltooligosaccharide transport system substrate-binding protein
VPTRVSTPITEAATSVTLTPIATHQLADSTATPAATATRVATRPLLLWAITTEAKREAVVAFLAETLRRAGVSATIIAKSPDALNADLVAGPLAGLAMPDLIWGGADDLFTLQRQKWLIETRDTSNTGDFLPATIAGATSAGKRWGTPVAARGYLLLLYNKQLVDNAPQTTNDLIAQARRRNSSSRAGLVAGWVEMRWLAAWQLGYGAKSLNAQGQPELNTAAMISALQLLQALRSAGPPPPSTYAEGAKLFRDGKAAFAIDGEWALGNYRAYSDTLDLGFAALPRVSETGQPAIAPLEGVYLMYTRQLEASQFAQADQLARTLLLPMTQQALARELGYLPALRSELTSSTVRNDPALAAAAISAAQAPGIIPNIAQRCIWEVGELLLPELLLGESAAAEVAERLQERSLACVAQRENN